MASCGSLTARFLPAGRYRVEYVDGCLKYSGSQGWSLNAYADGHDGLVAREVRLARPTGS